MESAGPAPGQPAGRPVGRRTGVGDYARAVMRERRDRLRAEEPGTRLGDSAEPLHDMRVAAQRLRAALRLYREHLPDDARALRRELGWLRDALGPVRDLDVQLERLAAWTRSLGDGQRSALEPLRARLAARRERAREGMLGALDAPRCAALYARLDRLVDAPARGAEGSEDPAVAAVAPGLILASRRRARKAARRARRERSLDAQHRLRCRCKALRYALELHAPLYGTPLSRVVRRLVRVQDRLGALQDARVAMERLESLAADDGAGLPPDTLFVMGRIYESYARRVGELLADKRGGDGALGGRRWDALERTMTEVAAR